MATKNTTCVAINSHAPFTASFSWGTALVASSLPYIIWKQFIGNNPFWLDCGQIVILLISFMFTWFISSLKPLRGFVLSLLAFVIGWYLLRPIITSSYIWTEWQHQLSPDWQIISDELVRILPAILMAMTLFGSHIRRKDLFLAKGNLHTPVQILQRLRLPSTSWLCFAGIFLLIAAIVLPLYLAATVHIKIDAALAHFPSILIAALLNSLNEEFQFRSILLARLIPMLGVQQAIWITTAFFCLGHFYGQPSGLIGILLAGLAGWVWGMSMIETKGIAFAWFVHFMQDIVIFSLTFI